MVEGWAFTILTILLGLLVLVGVTANALDSRDEARRHRRSEHHLPAGDPKRWRHR
ncbi:MAG: hypothetical protein ACLQJR_18025 [Stellaceae bacterium]